MTHETRDRAEAHGGPEHDHTLSDAADVPGDLDAADSEPDWVAALLERER